MGLLDPQPTPRTRIKFCGLTRATDVDAVVAAGADAVGFVFYRKSLRYLTPARAAQLAAQIPAGIDRVALCVNASDDAFDAVVRELAPTLLQFHGDESPARCAELAARAGLPFMRAARVTPALDLVKFAQDYHGAAALLLDAFVDGYGGGGHAFDWTLIPQTWLTGSLDEDAPRLVLSGGLNAANVADAIARVHPFAVDVSSGIEALGPDGKPMPGVKDPRRMQALVAAVRAADHQAA